MSKEDLVAERIAIDSYREMIRYFGGLDPTTSDMLKKILAVEEKRADELADLLEGRPNQRLAPAEALSAMAHRRQRPCRCRLIES